MQKYYDAGHHEIKEGMRLMHWSGEIETVIKGENSLGFIASKDGNEIYPLTEFDLREWHIIKEI